MSSSKNVLLAVAVIFFAALSLVPPAIVLAAIAFSSYVAFVGFISGAVALNPITVFACGVVVVALYVALQISLWVSEIIGIAGDIVVGAISRDRDVNLEIYSEEKAA
jgi:hypothetical protein